MQFDNLEETTRKESYEGRNLRWVGVDVSGNCGYVKVKKPVYPKSLNLLHPASKSEGTKEVIPRIDFPE